MVRWVPGFKPASPSCNPPVALLHGRGTEMSWWLAACLAEHWRKATTSIDELVKLFLADAAGHWFFNRRQRRQAALTVPMNVGLIPKVLYRKRPLSRWTRRIFIVNELCCGSKSCRCQTDSGCGYRRCRRHQWLCHALWLVHNLKRAAACPANSYRWCADDTTQDYVELFVQHCITWPLAIRRGKLSHLLGFEWWWQPIGHVISSVHFLIRLYGIDRLALLRAPALKCELVHIVGHLAR